jgi:hypothetical protein
MVASSSRLKHHYDHETEWWTCWTENNEFHGAGGPLQSAAMIETFRAWAEATVSSARS